MHFMESIDAIRREIVEVGRRLYTRGLVGGAEGNISVRLGGSRVLATPSGACKGFLDPESLVVTDMGGIRLAGAGRPSSELKMHLRIYSLRDDVRAVVHAHPPAATGFAIAGRPLDECVVPEVIATLGWVPIVPYGTPSTEELADRLAPYVQTHDALLLANHGAVTFSAGLEGAINAMESIEQAARSMLVAHLLGRVNKLSREDVDRLLTIDAYGAAVRNPGCVWTEEPADKDLEQRIAAIVRETVGGSAE